MSNTTPVGTAYLPERRSTITSTVSASDTGSPISVWLEKFYKVTILLRETGSGNAITYKIDASMDSSNWQALKTATQISAGSKAYETLTDPWKFLKITVQDVTSGSSGSCEYFVHGVWA